MVTFSHARTVVVVLVLAVVALGLLAVRSARRADGGQAAIPAAVSNTGSPGAGAHQRHVARVALGR
jgi:hypothetical protein